MRHPNIIGPFESARTAIAADGSHVAQGEAAELQRSAKIAEARAWRARQKRLALIARRAEALVDGRGALPAGLLPDGLPDLDDGLDT